MLSINFLNEKAENKLSLTIDINVDFGFFNVNIQAKLPRDCDETSQMFLKKFYFTIMYLCSMNEFSYHLN